MQKQALSSSYLDLNIFRQGSGELHERPYEMARKRVRLYRLIFGGLGVLFAFLGGVVFFKTQTWACHVLLGNCYWVKGILAFFCAGFSAASSGVAAALKPEKEAVYHAVYQAKRQLSKAYQRKRAEYNLSSWMLLGEAARQTAIFRHLALDARDKIEERQNETSLLLENIAQESDGRTRAKLFNQAILELTDKMRVIVDQFSRARL